MRSFARLAWALAVLLVNLQSLGFPVVINGQLLNGSKCGPFLLERSVCGVFGLFCLILTSQFLHSPSLVGTGTAREQRHRLASVLSGVIFMVRIVVRLLQMLTGIAKFILGFKSMRDTSSLCCYMCEN